MPTQKLFHGSAAEVLRAFPDNTFHACVTDPPAGVGFMGKGWDTTDSREEFVRALCAVFAEVNRTLRPGAFGLAWALPRTGHWTALAIEDAGLEIRDRYHAMVPADYALMQFMASLDPEQRDALVRILESQSSPIIHHVFLNGFPKSQDVRRELDMYFCKLDGRHYDKNLPQGDRARPGDHLCPPAPDAAHREGFGTGLKPTVEHWILFRKPMAGTQAANQIAWGTGGLNIDGTRVPLGAGESGAVLNGGTYSGGPRGVVPGDTRSATAAGSWGENGRRNPEDFEAPDGRWPRHADLVHSPACRCVGTTTIKAVSGTAQGRMAGQTAIYGATVGSTRAGEKTGFGDADGNEVVQVWECTIGCPVRLLDAQAGTLRSGANNVKRRSSKDEAGNTSYALGAESRPAGSKMVADGDSGTASRLFHQFQADVFYCPKATVAEKERGLGEATQLMDTSREEGSLGGDNPRNRGGKKRRNTHPTVKPIALMRHLVRLITPPGGSVLDPYAGTGTTLIAAEAEGCDAVGIEREEEYVAIYNARERAWRD